MRIFIALVFIGFVCHCLAANKQEDAEDNEFAEFEEFDEGEQISKTFQSSKKESVKSSDDEAKQVPPTDSQAANAADEEDAVVENEEDEFDHFTDEEEFEGFDKDRTAKTKPGEKTPELKINKVPIHLRTNWDSFFLEMLMLAGLAVYFLNFLVGKAKNQKLAQAWLNSHRELLESNFSVVGDDGQTQEVQSGVLMKESENVYSLWCSGRTCCEGMLVEIKLLKRQDLVNTISRLFKPAVDQVYVKVDMDVPDMDSFVFFLGQKKILAKMQKEMNDLSLFCPDKKGAEKFGAPSSFQILSEIGEATTAILDKQVNAALAKYENVVEYMHFSDQYSGQKSTEESQTPSESPKTKKVLHFCFNLPKKGNTTPRDMENLRPLMQMVFHCIEKVRRIHLSKEAKYKADKNRQKVEESMMKLTHSQRQEAAQQRREDKRRAEKERIMNEEDPDKQRKWEDRENRREMKRKQPKVKMMKI